MQISMRQEFIRMRLQVQHQEQRVACVDTDRLALHPDATSSLQKAASQVADAAGLPVSVIHDRLFQYVFRLVPSGILLLVLAVPERDIEMTVELPPELWKMTDTETPEIPPAKRW